MKKLALCWGSLDGVGFEEFLDAAAEVGFDAITLNTALYEDAVIAGAAVPRLLEERGMTVSNIDPLFNWLPDYAAMESEDIISRCTRATKQEVFQLAHTVGTDLVNAPAGMAIPDSEQELIDSFASLCDEAAREDLRVCLEFMPFTAVKDLAAAMRILEGANQPNGGLMLDCWHHHRSGGSAEDILAVPGEKVFALQLDDALPTPMDDMLEETLNHRLLPGEGCIDLMSLLRNLDAIGAEFTCDVEVFKAPLRELAPLERAQILYDSSRNTLRTI